MHDTLQYVRREPVHRRFHHDEITFRSVYAFTERYVLPLSHDEVVHGKGSMLGKMPGDEWQRFANLRLLYGMMWAQPGKKLLFMGGELATYREWNHDGDARLEPPRRAAARRRAAVDRRPQRRCTAPSRRCGAATPTRPGSSGSSVTTTPTASSPGCASTRRARRHRCWPWSTPRRPSTTATGIGVPEGGRWDELLNSDAEIYGGSGMGNLGGVDAEAQPWHGFDHSLPLTLPPLAVVVLRARLAGEFARYQSISALVELSWSAVAAPDSSGVIWLASSLPSSTPHWSKLSMPHTTPWTNTMCS